MTPCYKCEHAMQPGFPSKFPLWCFNPGKLKAPARGECVDLSPIAGTDEVEVGK